METKVRYLFFLPGGNTAVFDQKNQQIPDLQKSWLMLFLEFLQGKGVKIEDIEEIKLAGREVEYLKEYHNWKFK